MDLRDYLRTLDDTADTLAREREKARKDYARILNLPEPTDADVARLGQCMSIMAPTPAASARALNSVSRRLSFEPAPYIESWDASTLRHDLAAIEQEQPLLAALADAEAKWRPLDQTENEAIAADRKYLAHENERLRQTTGRLSPSVSPSLTMTADRAEKQAELRAARRRVEQARERVREHRQQHPRVYYMIPTP